MNIIDKLIDLLDPLGGLAKICGIAGVGLGIFFLILKQILKKAQFADLSKRDTFRLFRLLIWVCFVIALLGILITAMIKINDSYKSKSVDKADSLKYEPLKLKTKGIVVSDSTNTGK